MASSHGQNYNNVRFLKAFKSIFSFSFFWQVHIGQTREGNPIVGFIACTQLQVAQGKIIISNYALEILDNSCPGSLVY